MRLRSWTIAALAACVFISTGCGENSVGASTTKTGDTRGDRIGTLDNPVRPELTDLDREALKMFRAMIAERWIESPQGFTTKLRQWNLFGQLMPGDPTTLYMQFRELGFEITPRSLTEADQLNGIDYDASIQLAGSPPMRYFSTAAADFLPAGWSDWTPSASSYGARAERRKGVWKISGGGDLFNGVKPTAAELPPSD